MENPEKNVGDVRDMGTEQNIYTYNVSPRGREDKNGAGTISEDTMNFPN